MFSKVLKYLLIAGINMLLLTLLLALWTDEIELSFNLYIRQFEFLKIICLTLLILVALRLQVTWFRKRQIFDRKKKLNYNILLVLTISSYLYVPYLFKASKNRVIFAGRRSHIEERMKAYPNQTKADSLSYDEYREILGASRFPEIPELANNISVEYYEDGFLPDFHIQVEYEVPLGTSIKEENYKEAQYSKRITVQLNNNKKIVLYSENLW